MTDYDAIVVGVGGMGSAALYHLARRGLRVLGIEQFGVAHDRGSSHGQTRIIRKAYFEHPSYVPLLHRAYELWSELERVSGRELFRRTGLLLSGPADGPIISGVERSAREHRLQLERLSAGQAATRFDGFHFPAPDVVLFEPDAGFLRVEECVRTFVAAALGAGAQLRVGSSVESWSVRDGRAVIRAAEGEYSARALVVTGGAWAGQLLAELRLPLEVRRKVVFWYEALNDAYDLAQGCPVYGFDTADGFMYGFPMIDASGVKVAQHAGGRVVNDPSLLDRGVHAEDEAPVHRFIERHLPCLRPEVRQYSVCMYTMTPDEHFIIDRHPVHANVIFAAGFSGHGFKFAPVVGSILADLVVEGRTEQPIGFLSLGRRALGAGF